MEHVRFSAVFLMFGCFRFSNATTVQFLEELGEIPVKRYPLTISGFSSGGNMAQQVQVAFSSCFNGSAAFASVPYHCGTNGYRNYRFRCNFGLRSVTDFVGDAHRFENQGKIDSLDNLKNQYHYHFIPKRDTLVLGKAAVRANTAEFYKQVGMKPSHIKLVFKQSDHYMPTSRHYETKCTNSLRFRTRVILLGMNTTGAADCNYDGAFEALSFLFQDQRQLIRPAGEIKLEPLRVFNQSKYIHTNLRIMDPVGYLYVPYNCSRGALCNVHIALHGCRGSRSAVGSGFITRSGYLDVAEVNNIVMLFPQSIPFPGNPHGCWDVFEATGPDAATKNGLQMQAMMEMVKAVAGIKDCGS